MQMYCKFIARRERRVGGRSENSIKYISRWGGCEGEEGVRTGRE
jgi:hypothetical protein